MPPESDSAVKDLRRREIRRILAAGRPRRLRPLDLVMLLLIAGHLLVDNLHKPPAQAETCLPAAAPPRLE